MMRIFNLRTTQQIQWSEIILVTCFWLLLMILAPFGWHIDFPNVFWVKQVLFALVLSLIYGLNGLYWAPKIEKIGLLKYTLIAIAATLMVLVTMQLVDHLLNLPELMHKAIRPGKPFKGAPLFRFDFAGMIMTMLTLGIGTIVTLVRKGQADAVHREQLEKQQANSELALLKAQINPHFFFNTLNSIYALTSINIEQAQEAIHTLSAMMRYVLYESSKDHALISQEIKFISNYIELMKLRLTKKTTVVFAEPAITNDSMIAPMLLLPIVENAFKHGVSAQNESEITIELSQSNGQLTLKTDNQVFDSGTASLDTSGIGLTNTRRRLELLYPGKHTLSIQEADGRYRVELILHLQ